MNDKICYFYIRPNGSRPDYRLFMAFLWHEGQDIDSDGDPYNPASKEWTCLFLCNRENKAERVMISPIIRDGTFKEPLILEVKSECDYLAVRCAYFLAITTDSGVSEARNETPSEPSALVERMGAGFDVEAALRRVENSPFSRSTLENPYPNLSSTNA